jgi:cysteinyl-tRNA synthetase
MSQKYLGDTFDIHGGGLDLVFPHHENEIAQAESLTGELFVRYWIHNGPLTREGIKMSKSLGNILSIQEALQQYHPEELRLFMFMGHYRKPLDFSSQGMAEAQAALDRIYSTLKRVDDILAQHASVLESSAPGDGPEQGPGRGVRQRVQAFQDRFREAVEDDFNTAVALAHLFDLNRVLNQWLDHKDFSPARDNLILLRRARACYHLYEEVLGLLSREPDAFFRQKEDLKLRSLGLTRERIEDALEQRSEARNRKDWKEADRIRDELQQLGIQIQDTSGGSTWKVRPGSADSEA